MISGMTSHAGASQRTNTMAILALVFAFVFSPLGIIFGFIARKQIRQSGEGGAGLALAGIILGAIFLVLGLIYVFALGALLGSAGTAGA